MLVCSHSDSSFVLTFQIFFAEREQEESKRKAHRTSEADEDAISLDEIDAVLRVRFSEWPEQMREEIAEKLIGWVMIDIGSIAKVGVRQINRIS